MSKQRIYLCIDLKSFYASVECVERGLDAMTTDLVVADPERTEKTICLAVSPSLKAKGVKNRCRVFEIPKNIDYIMAQPRMHLYIEYAAEVYGIYLKYISKDDIHVYSIDEAFLDVTDYLAMYNMRARELASKIMNDIYDTLGITATCGIGTNLYLCKIALDITAKHAKPDINGARIGMLTEGLYQKTLWEHQPLTDFWRVGRGTAERLAHLGIFTMGQIATADEDMMYRTFGIDAELLIDHAYGREPVTIADIKAYRPKTNCLSSGQVLMCGYEYEKGGLVVREMADSMSLDLVAKGLAVNSITLDLIYEKTAENRHVHGTSSFESPTSSTDKIIDCINSLYERIAVKSQLLHKIGIGFNNVVPEVYEQFSFFADPKDLAEERKMQEALLTIKQKYGKDAILKGMNFEEGATQIERNSQIGGHKA